jgi:hypothetical protein
MIIDWRGGFVVEGVPNFRCFCADTGEELSPVFFIDTVKGIVGRYKMIDGRYVMDERKRVKEFFETRRVRLEVQSHSDDPVLVKPA